MTTATVAGASRIIAVDLAASLLRRAENFGTTHTVVGGEVAGQQSLEIRWSRRRRRDGGGGLPATFDLCTRIVRPGGLVANIGLEGAPTTLHLEELDHEHHDHDRSAKRSTIPTLLQLVRHGHIEPEELGTVTNSSIGCARCAPPAR